MWENIIWTVFFSLPLGVGWVAMSLSPPEFTIARVGFIMAALVLLGRVCWWISIENQFTHKILIVISISTAFLFIGLCLACGLYWLDNRETIAKRIEDRNKEVASPSQPALPTTLPATTSLLPSAVPLAKTQKQPELVPDLSCKLEYPYKREKDGAVRKQIRNPKLIITNIGPIKAVAFSVDYKSYLYEVSSASIVSYAELAKNTTGHLIFVKELAPSEEIKQDLNGFHWKSYAVGVYIFELKFYREADMKLFTHKYIYFIDNYNIFLEKDYSKNANYSLIIKDIKNFKPTDKAIIVRLDAVADHVWFSKETPQKGIHLLSADGKSMSVTSVIPDDPRAHIKQTYSYENRPVLYIKPSQFKSTGTYLNPKIVDNITVTTEISYEVENVGNEDAANVREMGGQPYGKLLKPGEKFYLRKQIEFKKGGNDKHSSEDFIKEMENQDYPLGASNTVLYCDKSKTKEYSARFTHGIGRNKFQLIMYQAN